MWSELNQIEMAGGLEAAKKIVANAPQDYKSFNTLTKKYWWCEPVMSYDVSITILKKFIPYFDNEDDFSDLFNHLSPNTKVIDQYTEHRTKAEQQINNGACLTKHQIDL
jgi:hypothetical protein